MGYTALFHELSTDIEGLHSRIRKVGGIFRGYLDGVENDIKTLFGSGYKSLRAVEESVHVESKAKISQFSEEHDDRALHYIGLKLKNANGKRETFDRKAAKESGIEKQIADLYRTMSAKEIVRIYGGIGIQISESTVYRIAKARLEDYKTISRSRQVLYKRKESPAPYSEAELEKLLDDADKRLVVIFESIVMPELATQSIPSIQTTEAELHKLLDYADPRLVDILEEAVSNL